MGEIKWMTDAQEVLTRHGLFAIDMVDDTGIKVASALLTLEARLAEVERERDAARDRQRKLRILVTHWRSECGAMRRYHARVRRAAREAEAVLDELADVDTFECEHPWPENEKPEERAAAAFVALRAALAEPAQGEGEER